MSSTNASTYSELVNIAVDAIARASTSSQVLSLDLLSIILILVLKIIIGFVQWVNGPYQEPIHEKLISDPSKLPTLGPLLIPKRERVTTR